VLPSFLDLAPDLHRLDADRGATLAGDEEFGTNPLERGEEGRVIFNLPF